MQATFKVYIKMYWNQSGKLEVFDTAASMAELMDNDGNDEENDREDDDESDEENEEPTPSKDKNNNNKKVEEGKNRKIKSIVSHILF
jgi:hypothetical protein